MDGLLGEREARSSLVSERLTNSEIELLRRDRKETHDYCQKRFGHQANSGQAAPVPVGDRVRGEEF